jgi:hypothetical protein
VIHEACTSPVTRIPRQRLFTPVAAFSGELTFRIFGGTVMQKLACAALASVHMRARAPNLSTNNLEHRIVARRDRHRFTAD